MPVGDGTEPVTDDEIVLRRVANVEGLYDPQSDRPVAWQAFRPNANDTKGLSLWRARYASPKEVAAMYAKPGRTYFVVGLSVRRLRAEGLRVEPSPAEGGPGHASLVDLTASEYEQHKDRVRYYAEVIVSKLLESVAGPFDPFDSPSTETRTTPGNC
jgi:hypothetical protein